MSRIKPHGKFALSDFNARPEQPKLTRKERSERAKTRAAAMREISNRWAQEQAERKAMLTGNDPALKAHAQMLRECFHENEEWLTEGVDANA